MPTRLSTLWASCTATMALTALAIATQEPLLRETDLRKLGQAFSAYLEAVAENSGVFEAQEEVATELEKVSKKIDGRDPLSSPADIGQALWLSNEYHKKRVKKGKVEATSYDFFFFGEDGLEYAVWVPKDYNGKEPTPVLLVIAGEGETPHTHITEQWISPEIRDNVIVACPAMPEDVAQWTVPGSEGSPGGVAAVLTLMKALTETYAVDFDRVYIAGRGAGVSAAVAIADLSPDRFAGVIGRSGDAGTTQPVNFQNLPTFFAGAGGEATAFQKGAEELGYENVTLAPEGKEADVWSWMQEHPRATYPSEVTLSPSSPRANGAYWLQVPPLDSLSGQKIHARVDRETNTIHVEATGVSSVNLFFNDSLVDLGQPVRVVCNGAESVDTIPRSLKTTLDLFYNARSDPGRVFVATKIYDVPAASDGE